MIVTITTILLLPLACNFINSAQSRYIMYVFNYYYYITIMISHISLIVNIFKVKLIYEYKTE